MALLFTENVLESLTCNTCHKFLSVQPIKVYPNRKIKCGRCSEDGDAGVVSLFNLLADQCVFKCVNRFEGCRKLLTCSDVRKHELECDVKSYICPVCSVYTMVPTFLMISHFRKEHKNLCLNSPSFFIDLKESLQINKFFLYKHNDRLFIIIFRTDSSIEYIAMSAMLLGDSEDARNIRYRFTLCTPGTDFEVHSREKLCDVFDSSDIGGIEFEKFKIPKSLGILNVTFRMSIVNDTGMLNLPNQYHSSGTEPTDQTDEKCFNSRFVYLDNDFRETYPRFSIGLNLTSLMKDENTEIILSCSNCSLLIYCSYIDYRRSVCMHQIEQKYYFLCLLCSKYIENTNAASCHGVLGVKTLKNILFFCMWKCGKFFKLSSLNEHEINCSLQPFQNCPVNYCKYKYKLFDIKQHMIKDHFNEISQISYEIPNDEGLSIPLLIDTSPIKWFVLVEHKFIFIKIIWDEPQWNISIYKCTPCEKCDAVAIIFDNSYNLLSCLKQNQNIKICHMENLKIKCYFKMKGT